MFTLDKPTTDDVPRRHLQHCDRCHKQTGVVLINDLACCDECRIMLDGHPGNAGAHFCPSCDNLCGCEDTGNGHCAHQGTAECHARQNERAQDRADLLRKQVGP